MKIKIVLIVLLSIFLVQCKKDKQDLPELEELNVGELAHELLSDSAYKSLHIEIVHVKDHKPAPATIDNIKNFLANRLHKPAGITVSYQEISSPQAAAYSITKLKSLETQYRTAKADGSKITAYFFFADAGYVDDTNNSKVLGVAYKSTSMAIFEKTVQDYSGGLGQPSREKLETTVMKHELGHILGLVNVGTPMQTHHQLNGHHCDNQDCLMYYTAETSDIVGNLIGSPIPDLDQNCLNDLKANGGK